MKQTQSPTMAARASRASQQPPWRERSAGSTAAAMSVLRLGLHRAGVIDKMVPQAGEEWLSDRLNTGPPGGKAGHNVVDQLLHLAYGASLGALAGPMLSGRRRAAGCGAERPSA